MAKRSKGYFGLGRLISIILAIIPVSSLICGLIITAQRGKWLCFLIRLLLGWNIIYILDLVTMILYNDITILA